MYDCLHPISELEDLMEIIIKDGDIKDADFQLVPMLVAQWQIEYWRKEILPKDYARSTAPKQLKAKAKHK